jgi:uncharacterized protein YcnI
MPIHRLAAVATAAAAISVVLAGPASAHVTIPEPGTKGGFSIVTLSVPNERDDAGTVTIEVQLPQDHPLGSVRPQPKPGWTVTTTTRTLDEPIELFGSEVSEVIDTVTWTGGRIEPGQFDTFSLSVGPLPDDVDALEFPAIQTYDNGEEVAWIESTPEAGEEPEHPAPTLRLVDAAGDETAAPETPAASSSDDDGTDAVAVAGLAVAVVAALLAAAAFVTARRR